MTFLLNQLPAMVRLPLGVFLFYAPALATLGLLPIGWHAYWCIEQAAHSMQPVALLVAGLAFPPLGWAHGMSLLLGYGGWL